MLLLLYRGELGICWNILKESSLFKNEIKAIFIIIFLSSCSLFEEVEVPLDGERENVFEIDEKKLVKSFAKVYLPKPELVEDWNQNNQNKSNHLFHFSSNQSIEKKWEINIGEGEGGIGPYIISPIVYKNIIYTVDNEGIVQARDSNKGSLIWKYKLEEEFKEDISFIGGLSASNDLLLISTGLGNIYALDYKNGKTKWKKNFLSQISAPPVIANNKIFVTTDDNQLLAIELTSGDNIWDHSGNIENLSIIGGVNPAIYNDIIYVTYSTGEIFALNENNGAIQWYENIGSDFSYNDGTITDIQSPPVFFEDHLYVSSFSGKFVSFKAIDGQRLWELNLSTINPITISGDYIYLLDTNNKLYCITKNDGGIVWVVQLKKRNKDDDDISWVGPLLTSHKLIVASSEGTIISISPYNGKVISIFKEKNSFTINPIHAGLNIYFVSKEGNLINYK